MTFERQCEQRVKTTDRQHYSVLVLSEMKESERSGRVCRALKYQPKLLHRFDDAEEGSDEQHVCRTCGEGCTCRADLELHMEDHNIPGKGFRPGSRLDENEQKSEFPQSRKFVCNLCGVEYVRKLSLVTHMRIHTGETPYKCKVCGKGFRRSDWLAEHQTTHKHKKRIRKKQFACEHCEKVFRTRMDLTCHLRTHTGERPYSCAICQRSFYTESCHKRHLICHSDDRPYTCSECGHSFKRSAHLIKHQRIHTGEKPFSCSFCAKVFAYKHTLSLHMKNSSCRRSQTGTS